MSGPSRWGLTPRQSVEQECARRGRDAVVDGCRALLAGEAVDDGLVLALGGPPARAVLAGEPGWSEAWLRVWAARGLLWVWEDRALPAVAGALDDETWRVREMALKVVARHGLGETVERVAALRDDPVPRVRAAAERALVRLTRDRA